MGKNFFKTSFSFPKPRHSNVLKLEVHQPELQDHLGRVFMVLGLPCNLDVYHSSFPSRNRSHARKAIGVGLYLQATRTIILRTTWTNSNQGKQDLVVDQDQQYKITLRFQGKADRTAEGWQF